MKQLNRGKKLNASKRHKHASMDKLWLTAIFEFWAHRQKTMAKDKSE
jgi:hypothetical protein